MQTEQAQGFWADPLISEGYGMGTALLQRVLEDGTSQVRQTPEVSLRIALFMLSYEEWG